MRTSLSARSVAAARGRRAMRSLRRGAKLLIGFGLCCALMIAGALHRSAAAAAEPLSAPTHFDRRTVCVALCECVADLILDCSGAPLDDLPEGVGASPFKTLLLGERDWTRLTCSHLPYQLESAYLGDEALLCQGDPSALQAVFACRERAVIFCGAEQRLPPLWSTTAEQNDSFTLEPVTPRFPPIGPHDNATNVTTTTPTPDLNSTASPNSTSQQPPPRPPPEDRKGAGEATVLLGVGSFLALCLVGGLLLLVQRLAVWRQRRRLNQLRSHVRRVTWDTSRHRFAAARLDIGGGSSARVLADAAGGQPWRPPRQPRQAMMRSAPNALGLQPQPQPPPLPALSPVVARDSGIFSRAQSPRGAAPTDDCCYSSDEETAATTTAVVGERRRSELTPAESAWRRLFSVASQPRASCARRDVLEVQRETAIESACAMPMSTMNPNWMHEPSPPPQLVDVPLDESQDELRFVDAQSVAFVDRYLLDAMPREAERSAGRVPSSLPWRTSEPSTLPSGQQQLQLKPDSFDAHGLLRPGAVAAAAAIPCHKKRRALGDASIDFSDGGSTSSADDEGVVHGEAQQQR